MPNAHWCSNCHVMQFANMHILVVFFIHRNNISTEMIYCLKNARNASCAMKQEAALLSILLNIGLVYSINFIHSLFPKQNLSKQRDNAT